MCDRCMCVPWVKYPSGIRARPSVSRFAIRDGPRFSRSVEVKPRKSSASGGIRSAPGTPAATASLLGSPPPAKPRRTVVFVEHAEIVEERLLGRRDRVEAVAAEQHGDVVLLELGVLRVAREPLRVEERRPTAPGCRTGWRRSHWAGT